MIDKETAIYLIDYINDLQGKLPYSPSGLTSWEYQDIECYCPECDECFEENIYIGDLIDYDIQDIWDTLSHLKTHILDLAGGIQNVYGPFKPNKSNGLLGVAQELSENVQEING